MTPVYTPASGVARYQFSVEQYHLIIQEGILAEDAPVELIRGEIVNKMPIGNLHAATVKRLNRLLSKTLSADSLVSIQDPILLDDSEPEPDVAVLKCRDDLYATRRPTADDVLLLMEVADTSLGYDRETKGSVYAEAGIAEYWIVNLNSTTIEIYRDPQNDGRYATVTTAKQGDVLRPLHIADVALNFDDVLMTNES